MTRALPTLVIVGCVTACSLHQVRQPERAFACEGPPIQERFTIVQPSTAPIGRFELKAIDGADAGLNQRLQIVSDAVPLSTVAVKLSEAVGAPVSVSQDVLDARVSVTGVVTRLTLGKLLQTSGVYWSSADGAHEFVSAREHHQRYLARTTSMPRSIVLVPVRRANALEQLATAACAMVAGPGGSVAVVGDTLLVRGYPEHIAKVRALVESLDAPKANDE